MTKAARKKGASKRQLIEKGISVTYAAMEKGRIKVNRLAKIVTKLQRQNQTRDKLTGEIAKNKLAAITRCSMASQLFLKVSGLNLPTFNCHPSSGQ